MSASGGPELRGSNITLANVLAKTDLSGRQTKIICTMGPSCWDVPKLEELIDAGYVLGDVVFTCLGYCHEIVIFTRGVLLGYWYL